MLLPKLLREGLNPLRFVKNESEIGFSINGKALQKWDSYYIKIFSKIDAEERRDARVAHLGGGMGWLPKMLLGYYYEQDVYEIEPEIVSFLRGGILEPKVNFILGDWKRTLAKTYDIIIYDIDEPIDLFRIYPYCAEGASIYTLTD